MKMKTPVLRSLIAAMCAALTSASLAMPVSIAYQGVLRDIKGAAVSPLQQTIEFRLYREASSETDKAIWGRSVAVLLDKDGLFNVSLEDGNGSTLEPTVYDSLSEALKAARTGTLFIGLTVVGSSGEIAPRQQILTVPYAAFAQDVDAASGDFMVAGRAQIKSLEVAGSAVFKGAVDFSEDVTIDRKLTVSGGIRVSSGNVIEGYGTIPVGGIIMWRGSVAPDGWAICDGSNGTPDLRNRFVRGMDPSKAGSVNSTGGSDRVTLKTENLPPHRHEYFGDDQLEGRDWETTQVSRHTNNYDAESKLKGSSKVYWSGQTGSGKSFEVLPPYYSLAFIMRVK